jgi:tRNA threonylcarbamoyladenosine biosynthesis protein TsaE
MKVLSHSEEETFEIGRHLAKSLRLPAHILLYGDLGAGKTALTRGLAAGFGLDSSEVSSPTFTLVNSYLGDIAIFHIDLYRIGPGQLEGLGLDEIFDHPKAAVIVEWAERLGNFPTPGAVKVFLEYVDERTRRIEVAGDGLRGFLP